MNLRGTVIRYRVKGGNSAFARNIARPTKSHRPSRSSRDQFSILESHGNSFNNEYHFYDFFEFLFYSTKLSRLFVLFRAETRVGVRNTDGKLLGTFDYRLALLAAYCMSDFRAEFAVLHHQDLQLLNIVYEDLAEAGGQHVTGLLVASVTDVGHQVLALETPAHSVVDTLGLTPVALQLKTKN